MDSTFRCPGFKLVEDRRIRCHKTTGHGAETFVQATMNSYNPVFIELATMSFGQSFQITPLKLLRAASEVINGGTLVTPHFGIKTLDEEGNVVKEFTYGKYMASFIGYAPANDPEVIAICIIDEPVGIYYGGTIAAPVIADIYSNILPYLEIEKSESLPQND